MADTAIAERTERKVGRPSRYSEAVAQAIFDKLSKGVTRTAAAEAAGISREAFYDWTREYDTFLDGVLKAEAEAEAVYTQSIYDAAVGEGVNKDWRAGETWLKRRRRADYGDTLDIRKVDAETLLALLQLQRQGETDTVQAIEPGEDAL